MVTHRGNGPSTAGRKTVDQPNRVQFNIDSDTEDVVVAHSLPSQKHTKRKSKHSLKQAVEQNVPLAKKH